MISREYPTMLSQVQIDVFLYSLKFQEYFLMDVSVRFLISDSVSKHINSFFHYHCISNYTLMILLFILDLSTNLFPHDAFMSFSFSSITSYPLPPISCLSAMVFLLVLSRLSHMKLKITFFIYSSKSW